MSKGQNKNLTPKFTANVYLVLTNSRILKYSLDAYRRQELIYLFPLITVWAGKFGNTL